MSYQFVVISISEERKKNLEEQFEALQLRKYGRVHYINPATPDNLKYYLPEEEITNEHKYAICCLRSHLYAMEFACLESSPDFTIVMEDDVALHKTQFINVVEECIERWDEIMKAHTCRMLSLGYLPFSPRSDYDGFLEKHKHYLKCIYSTGISPCYVNGTQCYIIKKSDIKKFVTKFIQPTHLIFKQVFNELVEKASYKMPPVNVNEVDNSINFLLRQAIVYPPVVIERPVVSHINHDNWAWYWEKYFSDKYKKQLNNYFTF